jgi:hypothetical protein
LMLSVEMMRETAMKTCYAGWVHAPASVFFLLLTVAFCFLFSFVPLLSFSAWLPFSFFLVFLFSFFSILSFLFLFFLFLL